MVWLVVSGDELERMAYTLSSRFSIQVADLQEYRCLVLVLAGRKQTVSITSDSATVISEAPDLARMGAFTIQDVRDVPEFHHSVDFERHFEQFGKFGTDPARFTIVYPRKIYLGKLDLHD
jgi:hypothetical protein